ncbi:MAG: DNA polymerase III subunit delta', partial [Dehalococcoidia bacterium]|nr:DNA polymerase III subunit delta' [Dehalococcoidia bacterium]
IFILLTTNEAILPATVVSRCQRLELHPMATSEVGAVLSELQGIEPQKAKLLARLCRGCLGWAILAAGDNSLLQQRTERIDRLLDITNGDYEQRFDYVVQLVAQFNQSRGLVQQVLDLWLDWWRDLLLVKLGCNDAITNIDYEDMQVDMARGYNLAQIKTFITSIQAAGQQLGQNANPRLVLEVLMLSIPGRRGV